MLIECEEDEEEEVDLNDNRSYQSEEAIKPEV